MLLFYLPQTILHFDRGKHYSNRFIAIINLHIEDCRFLVIYIYYNDYYAYGTNTDIMYLKYSHLQKVDVEY